MSHVPFKRCRYCLEVVVWRPMSGYEHDYVNRVRFIDVVSGITVVSIWYNASTGALGASLAPSSFFREEGICLKDFYVSE